MQPSERAGIYLVTVFAIIGTVWVLVFLPFVNFRDVDPQAVFANSSSEVLYLPPHAEEAPEAAQPAMAMAMRLMEDTGRFVPRAVGNDLSCNNCHFRAGRSAGGKNAGISLVGVAAQYPRPNAEGRMTLLPDRINQCFRENLAGPGLQLDSVEMRALIVYLSWLSEGIPTYARVPWLNRASMRPLVTGNLGERRYQKRCSGCHGAKGEGTEIAPPVWGEDSFTSASGMANAATLAAFIDNNMPKDNPMQAAQRSQEVAAFLVQQPRRFGYRILLPPLPH